MAVIIVCRIVTMTVLERVIPNALKISGFFSTDFQLSTENSPGRIMAKPFLAISCALFKELIREYHTG